MKKKDCKAGKILWLLLLIYFVLNFIVGQLIGNLASRQGGILLISPVVGILVIYLIKFHGKIYLPINSYLIYILAFGLYVLLSSIWAEDPSLPIAKGVPMLETFIIMLVIFIAFQFETSINGFLKVIMYGSYIIMIYEILYYGWAYFVSIIGSEERITSEYLNSNTLGICIAFAIIINIYFFIIKKESRWNVFMIPIGIIIIAASGSRKALIALVLGIFLLLIFNSYDKASVGKTIIKIILVIVATAVIGYFILSLPMFDNVMQRMKGMLSFAGGALEKSAGIRKSMRGIGINLFNKEPILGIGMDNPRKYTLGIIPGGAYLHDNYVELLAGGGVLGLISYYWFYLFLFIQLLQYRKFDSPEFDITLVVLIVNLVLDAGMVTYYTKTTYIFLMVTYIEYKIVRGNNG